MADTQKPYDDAPQADESPNTVDEAAVEPGVEVFEDEGGSVEELVADNTKDELVEKAGDADVSASGTKTDIAERLVEGTQGEPEYVPVKVKAPHAETAVGVRQAAPGAVTPLQQRPVEDLDGHQAEQNVLYDDGDRIYPGDYHKPGAPLPPETEKDQQPAPQPELRPKVVI